MVEEVRDDYAAESASGSTDLARSRRWSSVDYGSGVGDVGEVCV